MLIDSTCQGVVAFECVVIYSRNRIVVHTLTILLLNLLSEVLPSVTGPDTNVAGVVNVAILQFIWHKEKHNQLFFSRNW